ncbi:DUF3900 domain-containing protein [Bacillus cereus]
MDFEINYLSFYVVQVEGKGEAVDKRYKHFQTLDAEEYEDSSLKEFLNGELLKISKRRSRTSCENRTSSDKDRSLYCRRKGTNLIQTLITTYLIASALQKRRKTSKI